ncbi:uncharacterized protein VTP21DRAFT_6464 [Calcarisporiella thermophila]|uniref:uncharacterized protein n=1 Tax=Calcarisporiella thermophila TaxID=911321 RepID=UPI0037427F0F
MEHRLPDVEHVKPLALAGFRRPRWRVSSAAARLDSSGCLAAEPLPCPAQLVKKCLRPRARARPRSPAPLAMATRSAQVSILRRRRQPPCPVSAGPFSVTKACRGWSRFRQLHSAPHDSCALDPGFPIWNACSGLGRGFVGRPASQPPNEGFGRPTENAENPNKSLENPEVGVQQTSFSLQEGEGALEDMGHRARIGEDRIEPNPALCARVSKARAIPPRQSGMGSAAGCTLSPLGVAVEKLGQSRRKFPFECPPQTSSEIMHREQFGAPDERYFLLPALRTRPYAGGEENLNSPPLGLDRPLKLPSKVGLPRCEVCGPVARAEVGLGQWAAQWPQGRSLETRRRRSQGGSIRSNKKDYH